jgi:phosphoglycerate dehydrogenase-like enzyme
MRLEFIGPHEMDTILDPTVRELADAGHDVLRHIRLPEQPEEQIVRDDTDVLIAFGGIRIGRETMIRLPHLRALISPITGTEGFDEAAATELGIIVANGQIPEGVSSMPEATVMLALAALYDLRGTERLLRESMPRPARLSARMLMGKTVGLIGFGQIAQAVALRLSAWNCRLIAVVRTPKKLPNYVQSVSIDDLLKLSDVVAVLSGLNEGSRGMLSRDRLWSMKPDVVFINVARGEIADQAALFELATQRPDMRLALDVFEQEPVDESNPLRTLTNAILTPHMVGHTRETLRA